MAKGRKLPQAFEARTARAQSAAKGATALLAPRPRDKGLYPPSETANPNLGFRNQPHVQKRLRLH
eukprot:1385230-Alexandrium_andersonii.AAC.1